MTYDIYCYKPVSRLPNVEEAKAILYSEELEQKTETPEEQDTRWKIVAALMECNPRLEPFGFDFAKVAGSKEEQKRIDHVELNSPQGEPSIQLEVYFDNAAITIPYWYEGPEADRVFAQASAYLRAIGEAAGYFVYDPQTETAFDPSKDVLGVGLYKHMTRRLPGIVSDIAKERQNSSP
jgi:hypothetical protein